MGKGAIPGREAWVGSLILGGLCWASIHSSPAWSPLIFPLTTLILVRFRLLVSSYLLAFI
jgi:hypothetical protein